MDDQPHDPLDALYRGLVEQAFDALVITRAADVVYANPAFAAMCGFPLDEIIGAPVMRFIAPECHADVTARMRSGDEARYEAIGLHRSGARVDVEIVARPCTYAGAPARLTAIRDISLRKQVARELARSEERFRHVIESHPDMVMVHRAGRVVYVNPRLVHKLGYSEASEVIGRNAVDMVHPDDRSLVAERMRRVAAGERGVAAVFRHARKDGGIDYLELVSVPIDYDGEPATLVIGRDVGERRSLEQRLIEAELMASVGMLAAAVTHEINNPLTYVTMTGDFLLREARRAREALTSLPPAQLASALDKMIEAAIELQDGVARVTGIARDFKTLTGVHAERIELVDVTAIIPSAVRIASAELRERARVELDLAPVPRVRANSGRLGQVVLNLLLNAVQAACDGRECVIHVRTRVEDGAVVIDVDDNGPGIPADVAGRVFEPFFSTKPGDTGSGLGLAISRGLVESFGGTLALAPSRLGGACFRIRLPAPADPI
jgi:PAS domain S-box-containing protein